MSTGVAHHAGLPFVPRPGADELLGSWLLRVAQLYGLGLATLLGRLGALQTEGAPLPHWFSIDASTVRMDALSAATHLSRSDLAKMTPSVCRPHWPEELGACERCLVDMTDAGEPLLWNRNWMSPSAIVCKTHGTWLTPVATRRLKGVRHTETFVDAIEPATAAPALLDEEPDCTEDALWLQDLLSVRTDVPLPWGRTLPSHLIWIVNAVAHEIIAAPTLAMSAFGRAANCKASAVKSFAFKSADGQRVVTTLPPQLRQRQWILARVAHILRWAPGARTLWVSWSPASVKRLASTGAWPEGALAWVCPKAADLVLRQDELRRKYSISPTYFKARSTLFASIQ